jgi:ribosomal protein S18 acetylase RimI-like enzyme
MPRRAGACVSDKLQIRLLTSDDAGEWWKLRQESLQQDPEAFSSSPEDRQSLRAEEVRQRLSSDPTEFFIVGAFEDRQLVGITGFQRQHGMKSCHKAGVWGVYVTPKWRGHGVGRRLMEALLKRASEIDGIEQILISVTATRTIASGLYRSLGFEPFGLEPRAVKVGDRYFDEEHMMLLLTRSR